MVVRKSILGFSITEIVSVLVVVGTLIGFLITTTSRVTACETAQKGLDKRQDFIDKRQDKIEEKLDKIITILINR